MLFCLRICSSHQAEGGRVATSRYILAVGVSRPRARFGVRASLRQPPVGDVPHSAFPAGARGRADAVVRCGGQRGGVPPAAGILDDPQSALHGQTVSRGAASCR